MLNSLIFLTIGEVILIGLLLYLRATVRIKVLKKYQSELAGLVEIRKERDGELRMVMNYCTQGISTNLPTIKDSYWGKIADYILINTKENSNSEVLHIGLGANTISHLIGQQNPHIHQTIIEIDPVIIQACKDFFKLDQLPNSEVIQADIFDLLPKKSEWINHFDTIVTDIYTGKESEYTPHEGKYVFINQLSRWLTPSGTIIFNRPAHTDEARADAYELEKFLKQTFDDVKKVEISDPRGFRNFILIATRKQHIEH